VTAGASPAQQQQQQQQLLLGTARVVSLVTQKQ
jgi:hypothetical protein